MKRTFTVVFLLSSIASFAQTPAFQWAKKIGVQVKNDEMTGAAIDSQNNLYITGEYHNGTHLDGDTLAPHANDVQGVFIAQLNAQGDVQWVKDYHASEGIEQTMVTGSPTGGVYFAAQYRGDVTIGGTTINSGNNDFGGGSVLVAKYNTQGDVDWVQSFEADRGAPRDIMVDGNGDVVLAGIFDHNIAFNNGIALSAWVGLEYEAFLVKLSGADGSAMWATSPESNEHTEFMCITLDDNNNIYASGFFEGDGVTFSPSVAFNFYEIPGTTSEPANRANGFVAKYSSAGNFEWAKQFKGEQDTEINITYANNALYTSVCNTPANAYFIYDGDSVTYALDKNFLIKLDPANGAKISQKSSDGFIFYLTSDNTGSVFVSSEADYNWMFDTYSTTSGAPGIAITKFDASDNLQWVEMRGGFGATVRGMDMFAKDGNILFSGIIRGASAVEFAPGFNLSPSDAYYNDGWYGLMGDGPLSVENATVFNEVKLFPNPSSETVYIQSQSLQNSTVYVYDISGQLVFQQTAISNNVELSVADFAAGVYWIQLGNSEQSSTHKLVVQ